MSARVKISGNLERELQRAVQDTMTTLAKDYQRMRDQLGQQYAGAPVEEIKAVLRTRWSRISGTISDPELSIYAQHISEGTPITVRTS